MSRDNGIYILMCKDQYRVLEMSAVDNLYWSFVDFKVHNKPISTRIIEYFNNVKSTKDINTALRIALTIRDYYKKKYNSDYEDGIKFIQVHKEWDEILSEAKELAPREIMGIKKSGMSDKYINDIKKLERIIDVKVNN